jgi:hypothetical protein
VDTPQSRQSNVFGHQGSLSTHESWGNMDILDIFVSQKIVTIWGIPKPLVSHGFPIKK